MHFYYMLRVDYGAMMSLFDVCTIIRGARCRLTRYVRVFFLAGLRSTSAEILRIVNRIESTGDVKFRTGL